MPGLQETLSKIGVSAESLDRIRLAHGVVGKSSYVAVFSILALAVVAYNLRDPTYLIVVACLLLVLFGSYFAGVLWFAHANPGTALLEGAELIKWRQLDMGIKGEPHITPQPNISPPPEITHSGGN